MRSRVCAFLLLACLGALVCAAALPPAAPARPGGQAPNNRLMKEHILLVQGYVEQYADGEGHGLYPAAPDVWADGGLGAPFWPSNPWTGEALQAGTAIGDYAYTVAGDRLSYTLTGHLAFGVAYTVDGSRAAPSADDPDAAAKTGICLIERFLIDAARASGSLPTVADLQPTGSLGATQPAWPLSPFDGQKMMPGPAPGQYAYTRGADGSYTLTAHLSGGDYTRSGAAYDWAAQRDRLAIEGATFISYGIELYSFDNAGIYPYGSTSLADSAGMYIDPWPDNPWFGRAMTESSARGDYDYSLLGDGTYSLKVKLCNGTSYDVAAAWTTPIWASLHRLPTTLKDLCAQSRLQVLKGYVDEWRAEHSGVLPSEAELAPGGAVGLAHTWWPQSQWTLGPMTAGTGYGQYEYAPAEDGSYTLTLHQQPLPDWHGIPGTGQPATYAAQ